MEGNLLLRTLTLKSKLGFGHYPDKTIQEMINNKKCISSLVHLYYNAEKIDFNEEIKDMLGIKFELVIKKPSKNPEMYKLYGSDLISHAIELLTVTSRNEIRTEYIPLMEIIKGGKEHSGI